MSSTKMPIFNIYVVIDIDIYIFTYMWNEWVKVKWLRKIVIMNNNDSVNSNDNNNNVFFV